MAITKEEMAKAGSIVAEIGELKAAIKLYCRNDCTYREKYNIENCHDTKCALWPWRMGK